MLTVPAATAVTRPAWSMVAIEVFELLHVPPASPSVIYVAVDPIHNGEDPSTVPALPLGLTVNRAELEFAVPDVLVHTAR